MMQSGVKRCPVAPTLIDWENLIKSKYKKHLNPIIDVLIPIYRGYEETMRCIYSVLNSSPKVEYRLVLVNDKSPDMHLVDNLEILLKNDLFDLYTNTDNLGFVRSCNLGMKLHPERDIVLLNSDTEVFGDWLDRLYAAAYRTSQVATVTPFSNNAEICSYPYFVKDNAHNIEISDFEIDQLMAEVNMGHEVEIPTGVGFCMYIRRACLNQIGLFDEQNFGHGYGEENDLCVRAQKAGWRNLLAADVFVTHYGGSSFGDSKQSRINVALEKINSLHPEYLPSVAKFIQNDPVLVYRRNVDVARLSLYARKQAVLLISHTWGGGTERHVIELGHLLIESGIPVFLGCPVSGESNKISIKSMELSQMPNLPSIDFTQDTILFANYLKKIGIDQLHVHHFIGFSEYFTDFMRLTCQYAGIVYDVTLHDYYSICPRITMTNGSGMYCGEPGLIGCNDCISEHSSPFGRPNIIEWRDRYIRFLNAARYVFVPDQDVAERMRRYMPDILFIIRPHIFKPCVASISKKVLPSHKVKRRVVILGALSDHKGSVLLREVAKIAERDNLPLEFVVIGYTDRDQDFINLSNVHITGRYEQEDLQEILINSNADFSWFPAVWPETYSYTLSAIFEAQLYPVAFDLGAVAARIRKANWGYLMPLSMMLNPLFVAQQLTKLDIPKIEEFKKSTIPEIEYPNTLVTYYNPF